MKWNSRWYDRLTSCSSQGENSALKKVEDILSSSFNCLSSTSLYNNFGLLNKMAFWIAQSLLIIISFPMSKSFPVIPTMNICIFQTGNRKKTSLVLFESWENALIDFLNIAITKNLIELSFQFQKWREDQNHPVYDAKPTEVQSVTTITDCCCPWVQYSVFCQTVSY